LVNDPNGILQDPTRPHSAANPYVGFQVRDEQLTLNDAGGNGLGSLYNATGNNTWAAPVILGSPTPQENVTSNVTIGANNGTILTFSGVIQDRQIPPGGGPFPLIIGAFGALGTTQDA